MLNSQPPDRIVPKSRSWFVRVLPVVYMIGTTLALPTIFRSEFSLSKIDEQQEEKVQQQIRTIAVKVLAQGEPIGSGILFSQQDRVYTVVTNTHALQSGSAPFQVQTPDGQTYAAALVTPAIGHTQDISLLKFKSPDRDYTTAKLATTSPKIGDFVWAAGYPLQIKTSSKEANNADTWGLTIERCQISRLLSTPLLGGYSIGYDQAIQKGMSGGPLVNHHGELVGVNGIHANPLWDAPETMIDGSVANEELQEQIDRLNWAIPASSIEN